MLEGERFPVTGALGCIGACVVRNLDREGLPITVFDLISDPRWLRLTLTEPELARSPTGSRPTLCCSRGSRRCPPSATAGNLGRRTAHRSYMPRPRARWAAGWPGCAPATSSASI